MGILEKIAQMKNQGMGDSEIAESLRQQGVTPKDISNALNQSQIKSAVAGEYGEPEDLSGEEYIPTPQYQTQEVPENYSPQGQNYQEYYPQQSYESYGAAQPSSPTDSMMDVAEQVFEEKTKKMQKQLVK